MHAKFPFYLSNNRDGVLWMPYPLTPADMALVRCQVEAALNITEQVYVKLPPPEKAEAVTQREEAMESE